MVQNNKGMGEDLPYDPNRLGHYVFVGDRDRIKTLDDLYWSYVMEVVAEHDPYAVSTGNYSLEYIKKNMKSASFGSVGIHKILARADQRAKERIVAPTKHSKLIGKE